MKAVVHDRYGPPEVLRIEEVERPVPKDDEVLVRVHATTVNRTDCHARQAKPFFWRFMAGLRRPKWRILGMRVRRRGRGGRRSRHRVRGRRPGVRRQGFLSEGFGAHAEFVCMRESGALAHKPRNLTFEEAAAVCDGAIGALTSIRQARCPGRAKHPRLRRLWIHRNGCGAAGQALRRRRHSGVQHEERRARAIARSRPRSSTTRRRTSRRTARRTTSSSTRSASTRSGAAGVR